MSCGIFGVQFGARLSVCIAIEGKYQNIVMLKIFLNSNQLGASLRTFLAKVIKQQ